MATKLNQIIAIEKGAKVAAAQAITSAYHAAQKPQLFQGISKTYRPKDEDGDLLPPESNRVQLTVPRAMCTMGRTRRPGPTWSTASVTASVRSCTSSLCRGRTSSRSAWRPSRTWVVSR